MLTYWARRRRCAAARAALLAAARAWLALVVLDGRAARPRRAAAAGDTPPARDDGRGRRGAGAGARSLPRGRTAAVRRDGGSWCPPPARAWAGVSLADRAVPLRGTRSAELFERARVTPGGVNSPVRAFRAVGGTPRFMASGSGAWLTDVDGRRYVDLVAPGAR